MTGPIPSYNAKPPPPDTARGREIFLSEVAATIPPDFLAPSDALHVLFSNVDVCRRVLREVHRRAWVSGLLSPSPVLLKSNLPPPSPPVSILSRLNRSRVFPDLVPAHLELDCIGPSLVELLDVVRKEKAKGAAPHELLDLLASRSHLSWPAAAELLHANSIIGVPMDEVDIQAVRQARVFWLHYFDGQTNYVAAVQLGQLPRWTGGNWALLTRGQFHSLLPGVVVPYAYDRTEFVTRYVNSGRLSSLHVYSTPGLPLFVHPFPREFNPLYYGKPLPIQHPGQAPSGRGTFAK
jgi:hypothetical protein